MELQQQLVNARLKLAKGLTGAQSFQTLLMLGKEL
jgi:hypothetical protein